MLPCIKLSPWWEQWPTTLYKLPCINAISVVGTVTVTTLYKAISVVGTLPCKSISVVGTVANATLYKAISVVGTVTILPCINLSPWWEQ